MHAQSNGDTDVIHLLLVDDDLIDREAVQRAFQKHRIGNPIVCAEDGIQALDILRGSNGEVRIPRPCMILLDINMPRMDGIEFLEELRGDPALADSIVFMLTTSNAECDKIAAYEKNVAGYLLKSCVGEEFKNVIGMLDRFWCAVEFPPSRGDQSTPKPA